MIPHQRQRRQAAPTNLFSFNNKQDITSDEVAFGRWAEKIKTSYSGDRFSRSTDPNVGPWTARSSPRRFDEDDDGEDDDVPSPTLWERKSYSSYLEYEEEEIEGGERFRPSSRAQAIARYRQEMLDLVKNVPENAYELSLRDIVESPRMIRPTVEEKIAEEKMKKGKKRAKKVSRSDSLDTGVFLLKMFVPQSFGRRQSFGGGGNDVGTPARSPKPAAVGETGLEMDWWKRNELSESSGSSSRGSRSSSTRRKMSKCFPIFSSHKNKALEL